MTFKIKNIIRKIGFTLFALYLGVLNAGLAQAKIVFDNEFPIQYTDGAWVIDPLDSASGNVTLQFGNTLGKTISFNPSDGQFEINDDLNLSQNQLKNVVLESLATAPLSPVAGQIYHNIVDQHTYIYNGAQWDDITAAASAIATTLSAVQARRTTDFTLTALNTWYDIPLDATDIETNADTLEHDAANLDRVLVKSGGTYRITYQINSNNSSTTHRLDSRIRVNDTTVLNGSLLTNVNYQNEYTPTTGSFVALLNAGDFITLQAQRTTANTVLAETTLTLVKLEGIKGDKGDKGDQGNPGTSGAPGDVIWMEEWQSQNYLENHAVYYQGSSYVCIQNTVSNEPPSDTNYWDLLAAQGEQGLPGSVGGGTDSNVFVLDQDDTGGDVSLQFGTVLNESIVWDSANSSFSLSDDLTIAGGLTTSGGGISFNNNSNFATDINTGSSTGTVSIGGGSNTIAVNSSTWDISGTGVASGFTGITSSGFAQFTGTTIIGGGSSIAGIRFGTCSVNPPNIPSNGKGTATCTATGVTTSDNVFVSAPNTLESHLVPQGATASAANTITVSLQNTSTGAVNGSARTWSWFAIR